MGHLFAHKTKIDRRFDSAQRMSGSHPLLQVHRVIKELRVALPLSHHDGNTALTDHRNLLHYFLFKTSDLGNTPSTFDIRSPLALLIAIVRKRKKGTEWSKWNERRLLLRRVDKENVAVALTGVIKRDSFSVGRPF